ncbi:phosphate ABC transporter substrate-binding protein [Dysgonomonas sp. 521]|uniref:PstS family phosphate ABC transporter substrate-binding protein n=1 Tax=Dysgonomonas sp. 521 TaxID=2302932 RepID=UPI0013D723E8|nr:substrate-binding domain-containing protein [Dysgonomonas sp. 521]NDV95508.1 phosphate ABC transporter substrate-binding protein [Dysgonomonas sp. 521]
MKNLGLFFLILLIAMSSCADRRNITRTDTTTSGIAEIAVDECFAPIIQEQVDVFGAMNNEALIIPIFTSENEAFNMFMNDSLRVIIATRRLTPNETQIIKERNQVPRTQKLAIDGIALIVNKANADTLITVSDLKRIMTGEVKSWKELNPNSKLGDISVVFDSPNSSTVRFIKDSICGGQALGENIKARSADSVKTTNLSDRTPNQQVIDYVAAVPDAIGVIGVNWISNPSDPKNLSFINSINVMSVSTEDKATAENSFKPFAAYLVLKKYPLTRDIFIIISDVKGGLPSGFVNFAAGERGQRIILKAGLYPANVPTRLVRANPTLKD